MQLLKRILVYGACIFVASAIFGIVITVIGAMGIKLGALPQALIALPLITGAIAFSRKFSRPTSKPNSPKRFMIKFDGAKNVGGRKVNLPRGLTRVWIVLLIPILILFFYQTFNHVEKKYESYEYYLSSYSVLLENYDKNISKYELYKGNRTEEELNQNREMYEKYKNCFERFPSRDLNKSERQRIEKSETTLSNNKFARIAKQDAICNDRHPFNGVPETNPIIRLNDTKENLEFSRIDFYESAAEYLCWVLFIIFGPPLLAIFLFLTSRFTYRWIEDGFRSG